MHNGKMVDDSLKAAIKDYFYLLEKGYPEKPTIKLVGDRYRLRGDQRMLLFRGITTSSKAANRQKRIVHSLDAKSLYIDGYNVLLTLQNFWQGLPVFKGNDGIIRDCGRGYGMIKYTRVFERAMIRLVEFLASEKIKSFIFYLDEPVSNSSTLQEKLMKEISLFNCNVSGTVKRVHSADQELKQIRDMEAVLATSDTEIIDSSPLWIADIPSLILDMKSPHHHISGKVLNLGEVLSSLVGT